MGDSRTSPQGFFSHLKSLFNGGNQPLNVEIHALRFFEACYDHFKERDKRLCYDIPSYTTPFPQETTRCIWCHIEGKVGEWQHSRMYTLSYNIYNPDGALLSHQTKDKLTIPLEYTNISSFTWRTFGYGWREPGYWPTGTYQAEVLIDGVRATTGHFTIAPPPPPKPAGEVLQQPTVRFYASGRETTRFPKQTTREVSCKLSVSNLEYGQKYRYYTVRVQWFTSEGRLLWEEQRNWTITSQEQEPSISWSIQTSGWSQGIYHVEIFIDGKEFAWGVFVIE